ncbi:MAG: hypothetical protein ACLGGV_05670 [Bacteroidia bacterium]
MDETWFNKLTLEERYLLIKEEGEFVASRLSNGYNVHLFIVRKTYVEMWRTVTLHQIQWIEIAKNTDILAEYVK